jgi:hypothetical protein
LRVKWVPGTRKPEVQDDLDMPLIPSQYMQAAAFVYGSEDNAKRDVDFIAAATVVSIPSSVTGAGDYYYVVTNEHVVRDFTELTIRFQGFHPTTGDSILHKCRFKKLDWTIDKDSDLAITPISFPTKFMHATIPIGMFVTEEKRTQHRIAYGDEVFLVGRLQLNGVYYTTWNTVLMRFGNISMLPTDDKANYIVELRSIGGHSGSPVFVYDTPFSFSGTRSASQKFGILFLGINRGHVVDYDALVAFDPIQKKQVEHPKWIVRTNMSLAYVIQGDKILRLLNHKRFVGMRKKGDADIKKLKHGNVVED